MGSGLRESSKKEAKLCSGRTQPRVRLFDRSVYINGRKKLPTFYLIFPSQDPEAIIVMLNHDLVAIDCKSPGYPCFKNPYAMDLNDSPVTCCEYVVDCPGDLIPNLYVVGSRATKGRCIYDVC